MDVLCVGHAAWDISACLSQYPGREQQVRDRHAAGVRRRAGGQRGFVAGLLGRIMRAGRHRGQRRLRRPRAR